MLRHPSLRMKILGGGLAVALSAGGVVVYRATHRAPPSFRRGGAFASVEAPGASAPGAPTASTATASTAETATTAAAATVTTRGRSVVTSATAPAGPPTTTRAPRTTVTTAEVASGPVKTERVPTSTGPAATTTTRSSAPTNPVTTTTSAPVATTPPANGSALPAFGTYTYAVSGEERAPFVGSRRYPDTMTTVVHGAPGIRADQAVFDLTYSDKHAEREIVGFRSDGIYFDFEGGSITFGPRTETSEADYDPPILQIPKPLAAGVTRSGVSRAKSGDGSVSRTEDWKVTVLGQEKVTVEGADVMTWKVEVDRNFRPGSADQGFRNRTYWFDPARNIWVKYSEVFHGERHTLGFSFDYDSTLTATLTRFSP